MAFAVFASADTGPVPELKLAGGLEAHPAAARLSEEEQAILCLDMNSIATLKAETAVLEDMSGRLRRMQATVDQIRELIEAMPAGQPVAPAPAAVPPPAVVPVAPAVTAPPPRAWLEGTPKTLIATIAGTIMLLLLIWLRRRGQPAAAPATATPKAGRESATTTLDIPAPAARARAAHHPHDDVHKTAAAAPAAKPPTPETTELPQIDQALELAEVMISMGLADGAAETLVDHIRAHPRRALYHWLKLLDIYKTSGNKEDFERSAAELRRNFNIQADDWQADDGAPPRSIEDYGHLCIRIQELWEQPSSCIEYMARLLEDNRGGTRLGFPQSAAEEILFLIALLRGEQ